MRDLVSILIPAYNSERWISEAIESALAQTWPKKEIIIVDDGSSDKTFSVAHRYSSKILKVVTQKNCGASSARNMAFSLCQGDYIQWLDADDLLAPHKIETQLKYSGGDRNDRVLYSSAFGKFFYDHRIARYAPNSLLQNLEPVEWLLKKLGENVWFFPAAWIVSREFTELAGLWDESLSLDDDGEYFCRLVSLSHSVKFVEEAKSYYRRSNADSLSKKTSAKACKSLFRSIILCIDYLRSLEDSERTKAACLNYLHVWLPYFYPEKEDILRQISELARELGGGLRPPTLGWKYFVVEKLFGYKKAKKAQDIIRKYKFALVKNMERMLCILKQ